jgi:hypothetical protein
VAAIGVDRLADTAAVSAIASGSADALRAARSVRDPDAADIDRLTVSFDQLMSYRCYEPGTIQATQHPVCQPVSMRQHFGDVMQVEAAAPAPSALPR